jgi:heme-degrading monooxygenase HmoA
MTDSWTSRSGSPIGRAGILMVSRWRDRDCFKAYMKSSDHRESHARIHPGLKPTIKLEGLEHMHTYEVVAE